jgi:RNA polymerase sigma factor (TIGR02999 family)
VGPKLTLRERRRITLKRSGNGSRSFSLDDAPRNSAATRASQLVALDDALSDLASMDPPLARLVELRFFGGLTVEETAEAVGVSAATVKRSWTIARLWLRRELSPLTR